MKNERKASIGMLGRQSAFLFIGNVFTMAVGFPFQIYLARTLEVTELGVFSLLQGVIGIVAGLLGLGVAPMIVKYIPQLLVNKEYSCVKKLVRRSLVFVFVLGLSGYFVFLYFLFKVDTFWPELGEYKTVIAIFGLTIPLSLIVFLMQQSLRGFNEIRYMVIGSSFLQLTIKILFALIFFSLGFQLLGYVYAIVLSLLVTLFWFSRGLRRKLSVLPKTKSPSNVPCDYGKCRAFALVMYGNSLVGLGALYIDRFMIGAFLGAGPVGVFYVIKQLFQMPNIILQMLAAVAAPMFSSSFVRGDMDEVSHLYHLSTDWTVKMALPLIVFLLIFAEPLLRLYGEEFAEQGKLALWILIVAVIFNLGTGPLGILLNMCGVERKLFRLNVMVTVLQLLILPVAIMLFGLEGAAVTIAGATVINAYRGVGLAQREIGIRWWDRRYLSWILPGVMICLWGIFSFIIFSEWGPFILLCNLIAFYVIFYIIMLLQGLHDDDRELLRHLREKITGLGA